MLFFDNLLINNIDPPKYISLDEGELFDYDEYIKIEASKSKDLNK